MIETFLRDVLVVLIEGAGVVLLILWVAERVFNIRRETQRRKDEREADAKTARTYLGLLRDEVKGIEKWIPDQVTTLKSQTWGMAVPIQSPVWDLVEQAGELVALVEPELLKRTAFFYERLEMARGPMAFIVQSWLASEEHVADLCKKRAEAVRAVGGILEEDLDLAPGLVKSLEEEIVRLGGELERTGQG